VSGSIQKDALAQQNQEVLQVRCAVHKTPCISHVLQRDALDCIVLSSWEGCLAADGCPFRAQLEACNMLSGAAVVALMMQSTMNAMLARTCLTNEGRGDVHRPLTSGGRSTSQQC
jgi:hypothetical protein